MNIDYQHNVITLLFIVSAQALALLQTSTQQRQQVERQMNH